MSNSDIVIKWCDRMMDKTGLCGAVLCEALAEYQEESGNEEPSDAAIKTTALWEKEPERIFEYVERSHKWCKGTLTWGCIHNCNIWRKENWKAGIKKVRE